MQSQEQVSQLKEKKAETRRAVADDPLGDDADSAGQFLHLSVQKGSISLIDAQRNIKKTNEKW